MKFIHCADIHLDSKIEANLPSAKSKERKREVLRSFLRLCEYAEKNGVTAVIIAGDLFDGEKISPVTRNAVLSEIADKGSVDFLYLCGNHDDAKPFGDAELPDNLKLFKDSWVSYRYGKTVITGAELTGENYRSIYGGLCLKPDDINIVTMHGQVSSSVGEDCIVLNELASHNIDYLALGHIHSYRESKLDGRGKWCYSGCLEGRGFDECGDKGFVMLEVDENGVTSEFIKFNTRAVAEVECDISGLSDFSDILKKIKVDTSHLDASSMVKVVLTGSVPTDAKKDVEYFAKELSESFYFAKVKDSTRLEINPEDYMYDISLKGEFIRLALSSGLDGEQLDRVIECGLAALKGMEV